MTLRENSLLSQNQQIDSQLLLVVAVLTIFGLIIVYDSSVVHALRDFGDGNYYIRQQLLWALVGAVSAVAFTLINLDYLKKIATPFFIISLALLCMVFLPGFGVSAGGAYRWLNLGFVTIQPSELVKLSGMIYLATVFEKKAKLLPLLVISTIVLVIMALLQRDLGSAIVFAISAATIYFLSGGPVWQFLLLLPALAVAFLVLIFTSDYRRRRILAFLDPFSDPQGFTYHISQVLIALGVGGLTGLGLGQSRQKFEYIPEVTTDSIFAIIGEELGFLGGMVVIALFVFLAIRGFKIASNAKNNFGKILAGGLTSWIIIQAVLNLSSMVSLMPLTGVPLPFISYGGSALIANLSAVGILLNISRSRG